MTLARTLAAIAVANLNIEYPNSLALTLFSDADVQAPRALHPAFFGCYDWHSSVHTHWQLVRLVREFPRESFVPTIRAVLDDHLTRPKMLSEAAYMTTKGREGFERPYGLAWLLQLVAELVDWDDPQGNKWCAALAPVEQAAVASLQSWLPKLTHPIRVGEHTQTAFALGLVLDYSRCVGNSSLESLVVERSLAFYGKDGNCPLSFEPSGQDFLSPSLAEADLMRRILPREKFSSWLSIALPNIPRGDDDPDWLVPVKPADYTDGKLAHFDGLNLSRAWMLYAISASLGDDPARDNRVTTLKKTADRHAREGFAAVERDMDYAGSHWLGSFAVYLGTSSGI